MHGAVTAFLNHSCNFNLTPFAFIRDEQHTRLFPQLGFITTRPVLPGEELTINYGEGYFKRQNLPCRCGYSKCKLNLITTEEFERLQKEEKKEEKIRSKLIDEERKKLEEKKKQLMEPIDLD